MTTPRWLPPRLLLTVLAALGVGVLCLVAIERIRTQTMQTVRNQLTANVVALGELINTLHRDRLAIVQQIANDPDFLAHVDALLRQRDDPAAQRAINEHLAPALARVSFEHYVLWDANFVGIAALDPVYVGAKAVITPRILEQLAERRAFVVPPRRAATPSSRSQRDGEHDVIESLCAGLPATAAGEPRGVFCVATDVRSFLLPILRNSWIGSTGESFLVDADARLRTPGRFEDQFAGDADALAPGQMSRLHARVPQQLGADGHALPLPLPDDPPTALMAQLLAQRDGRPASLPRYLDYRNRTVTGAGLWLPELDLGVVIELDYDEAHAPSLYAKRWIRLLALAAVSLLLALGVSDLRARRRLAVSEARLAGFFDNVPVAMHIQDSAGRYLKLNPRFEEFLGVPAAMALGKRDDELGSLDPDMAARRRADREQVLATRQAVQYELRILDQEGEERFAQLVRFPIVLRDQHEVIGVGSFGLDITPQVRTRQALEQLTERLESEVAERTCEATEARDAAEAANRAKAQFLANMSHEIRTPLNAITGMARLALRTNNDARIARFLDRVVGSSDHLLGIVNDILDLSKLEAQQMTLDDGDLSPSRLLQRVLDQVAASAQQKGLELLLDIDSALPSQLRGDEKRLAQILINLMGNAVKFTDTGEVTLRVRCLGFDSGTVHLRFEVEDTGSGIAADQQVRLFQPFQQADSSDTRRHEGTGLGLAICRRLAETMGGAMDLHSSPGEGSRFGFTVRLAATAPVIATPRIPRLRGARALVVDDNARARQHACELLAQLGLPAQGCASGEEAIALLSQHDQAEAGTHFDWVLIDQRMPGLDGAQCARQLVALSLRGRRPRLLLMSTFDATEATTPGVFAAQAAKPLTRESLAAALLQATRKVAPTSMPTGVAAADAALQGLRVLLVEDNAINRELAVELLSLEGAEVATAVDGMDALRQLQGKRFDAVLMDVHMPVLDGIEATRLLRRDPALRVLPVIGLSASVLESDRARCLDAGMDDFLAKPIDAPRLVETLRQWADRSHGPGAATHEPIPAVAQGGEADAALAPIHALVELDVMRAVDSLLGRPALYLKLVDTVLAHRADALGRLGSALRRGEPEDAATALHNLAAALGSLGGFDLRRACLEAEAAMRDGQTDRFEVAEGLLQRIERLWSQLADARTAASAGSAGAGVAEPAQAD